MMANRTVRAIVAIAAMLIIVLVRYLNHSPTSDRRSPDANPPSPSASIPTGPSSLASAFAAHAEHVELEAGGRVTRILATDNAGARHEKFLVRAGAITVLVVHNIDIAPFVPVRAGDSVVVRGEYIWNSQGGLLHWTHHDPEGRHQAGWIRLGGQTYR
jgi:hypothetical protein